MVRRASLTIFFGGLGMVSATVTRTGQSQGPRSERFFLIMAIAMAATAVAGFSTQLAAGRSTFNAPLLVHVHAIVFFGWIVLYVLQNALAANRATAWHRRLGWLATIWIAAMVIIGCAVTVAMVRRGHVPFFFMPLQFLVFDPVSVMTFAGLSAAAIFMRRQTQWHRRLHYCGTALLMGPALGRLLPMPLLAPVAFEATQIGVLLFPAIGMITDWRRRGAVHIAWWWGVGAIIASVVLVEAITYSPVGDALYGAVTAGSPGAQVPAREFAPPPSGPLITGRSTST